MTDQSSKRRIVRARASVSQIPSGTEASTTPKIYGLSPNDRPIFHLLEEGNLDRLNELLAKGAHVLAAKMEQTEKTPLMVAARLGREDLCNAMLDERAPLDVWTSTGITPLHDALEYGLDEIALRMIKMGAPLQAQCPGQDTALHIAARYSSARLLRALVAAGADPNAEASMKCTPVIQAAYRGQVEIMRVLEELGASVLNAKHFFNQLPGGVWGGPFSDCLNIAAESNHMDLVSYLVEGHPWPQERKNVALKVAGRKGWIGIVRLLVAEGADPFAAAGANKASAVETAKKGKQKAVMDFFRTLRSG